MSTFRLPSLLSLGIACAFTGLCQSNAPPYFDTYTGPTSVYPDTGITFKVTALDSETYGLSYDLLAGPTNVDIHTTFDRPPQTFALINWRTPSRSAVGTTNTFVIRATDSGSPPLSTTNVVSIVVIAPPVFDSISLSNNVPVLQLNGLLADKTYYVEWTAALPATNWALLSQLDRVDPNPRPPVIRIEDTNQITTQRFYRIRPGSECYAGAACP